MLKTYGLNAVKVQVLFRIKFNIINFELTIYKFVFIRGYNIIGSITVLLTVGQGSKPCISKYSLSNSIGRVK